MQKRTAAVIICSALLGADWPGPHGPGRDNVSPEKNLNWAWPAEGPKKLWEKSVGDGFAGVAVAGKIGILFHRNGDTETIERFDAATGKSGWKFDYPAKYVDDFSFDPGPRATPVIRDGRIYAYGPQGDLTALELATGKKLWQRNLLKDYAASKGYFGAASSPLATENRLIVNVGGEDAGIVAFDPATGKEIWKATTDAAGYSTPILANIDDKDAVVAFTRSGLRIVDPESGRVRFSYPFRSRLDASVNAATPLVFKGDVFLTASYGTGATLLGFRGADAEEIWANDTSLSSHYCTPVRVGGLLFGVQ
jgi:outer membrane protein assembly factor BamB